MPGSFDRHWSDGDDDYDERDGCEVDSDSTSSGNRPTPVDEDKYMSEFRGDHWPFAHSDSDEQPSFEERDSLANVLNNLLSRGQSELPFAGRKDKLLATTTLEVDGIGPVTLPMGEVQAAELLALYPSSQCKHVGEIAKKHVKLDETEWFYKIEPLMKPIARHLGLKRMVDDEEELLYWELQKLVLYGEGQSPMDTIESTEKEGEAEAIVVVQLPSISRGGVVIVRGDDSEQRYELDGTSSKSNTKSNFVVLPSRASFALEGTPNQLHAALIFSIHLEPEQRYLSRALVEEPLCAAVSRALKRKHLHYPSVLLLKSKYTGEDLDSDGLSALTGVDRSRLKVLEGLNAVLPATHKLQFIPIEMVHEVTYNCLGDIDDWEEDDRKDFFVWYSIGARTQPSRRFDCEESDVGLEYMNPDDESFQEMWMVPPESTITMPSDEPYRPFPTKRTRRSRFAIIIMPNAKAVQHIGNLSGKEVAAAYVRHQSPADPAKLRTLLKKSNKYDTSKEWFRTVCDCLVKVDDMALVELFFKRFRYNEYVDVDLAKPIASLTRKFGWKSIEPLYLTCFRDTTTIELFLNLTVHVADALDGHKAQKKVLKTFCSEALYWAPHRLGQYPEIGKLWGCVVRTESKSVFGSLVKLFHRLGPDYWGSVIDHLAKYADKVGFSAKESDAFYVLVNALLDCLEQVVAKSGQRGVWEIPDAQFPDDPTVEAFLRGPEQYMTLPSCKDPKKRLNPIDGL
ncbi:hypothetical protein PHYBOEH_010101 [Phytophthora boehmeriae]|uniref:Uncharacterized protein n=1 Tax=Phytophthora boehmeriae TaxID=109152 RepID=A0A8T1VSC7_9STRA|nr:hypothetical protein PHYBOEH_010101 [Phytophthora boehmeriae]